MDEIDNARRDLLIRALSSGLFATGLYGLVVPAWAMGKIPGELPPGRSIYRLSGKVTIDNRPASLDTLIKPDSFKIFLTPVCSFSSCETTASCN